jgi:hypothetical protein
MARFEIRHFDEPLPVDRVIFAIDPVDSFTGGTVRGPVTAEIEALGVRARRNLSGLLVFINLERRDKYQVEIKAEGAGFFDASREIDRPHDDAPDSDRLETVELHPLPTAAFTHETTRVRGVVHLGGEAIEGVQIEAKERDLDPAKRQIFEGLSDRRGAFVLPLRLHPSNASPDSPPRAVFLFTFKHDEVPDRELQGNVVDGTAYRFGVPIELKESIVSPLLVPSGD